MLKEVLVQKGWADRWKRGIEANLLQLGMSGKSVVEPQKDSSIIYSCLEKISTDFATVPFEIIKGGQVINSPKDDVFDYFETPNVDYTNYEFWQLLALLFSLRGEVFIYLEKSVGELSGIRSLPGDMVILDGKYIDPIISTLKNGEKVLVGWKYNNKKDLSLDRVIHFKNANSINKLRGISPITSLQMKLDAYKLAEEYDYRFIKNDGSPGGIITMPEDSNDEQDELDKVKGMWQTRHGGPENTNQTAVFPYGMKYEKIALTQQEMDFINGRQFLRTDILSAMGVPGTVLGYDVKGNYDTIKFDLYNYWSSTIKKMAVAVEQRLNMRFFKYFAPDYRCRYNFDNVIWLQEDYTKRVEQAQKLFGMGYTRNELNESLKLNQPKDESGDDRFLGNQYTPIDWLSDSLPSYNEDDNTKIIDVTPKVKKIEYKESKSANKRRILAQFLRKHDRLERIFHKKIKGYFFKQRKEVLRILDNHNKSLEASLLLNELNIFDGEDKRLIKMITPLMKDAITAGGEFALELLGKDREYILNNQILLDKANRIVNINRTVFNQLKMNIFEGMNEGETIDEIAKRVRNTYNMAGNRSRVIARSEVTSAMNNAAMEEYKDNGVGLVEWLTAEDENVREEHTENGNADPRPPGTAWPSGEEYPSAVNCRCTLAPHIN